MERVAVRSRDLAIIGYDSETQILEVAFRSGGVYQYLGVAHDIYQGLMTASSMGVYFRDSIREQFAHRKLR